MYLIYKKTSHISGKFIFFYCRMTIWSYPTKNLQSLWSPTLCWIVVNLFLALIMPPLKLKTTLFPRIWSSSLHSLFVIRKIFPPPEEQLSKIEIFILNVWFSSASEFWLQKAVIKTKIKAFIFCRICIFWSPIMWNANVFSIFFIFCQEKKLFFNEIFFI